MKPIVSHTVHAIIHRMTTQQTFAQRIAAELGKSPINKTSQNSESRRIRWADTVVEYPEGDWDPEDASDSEKFDTAIPKPLYYYADQRWKPVRRSADIKDASALEPRTNKKPFCSFRLTTWNIDFQVPFGDERMAGALNHLSQLHPKSEDKTDTPAVIFLQEMVESDLEQIQRTQWIQDRFFITDVSSRNWTGYYGTTTLIDKRLSIDRVFRVHYSSSRMQRGGLFVDVEFESDEADTKSLVRLCNTHLESLVSRPPRRPVQLKVASEFMHGSGPADGNGYSPPVPYAAILAGDLNAFAPEDLTAPVECGLRDAFLALGGRDGTEEGFTWGQQVPKGVREKFGCSRMDKILFCGAVDVESLERIGAGVKVKIFSYPEGSPDEEATEPEDEEEVWVTDHLGLQAEFKILPSKQGKVA